MKNGKNYDGKQVDVFAAGVLCFTIIKGHYPFEETAPCSKLYSLLTYHPHDYWVEIHADNLSCEF